MDTLSSFGLTGFGLLWIGIHLIGLFAAWLVRAHDGRRFELFVQGGFFTSLLAVAITTVIGHICCLEMWPLSAVTLALMIVLPLVDWGTSPSVAVER